MPIKAKKTLTSKGVRMMMDAAIAKAAELRIAVTVAIVDDGGHLRMLERMEGGRFHTVHSATTKAVTAASNKRPTQPKGAQGQDLDVLEAVGLALAAGRGARVGMARHIRHQHDHERSQHVTVPGMGRVQKADVMARAVRALGLERTRDVQEQALVIETQVGQVV